MTAICCSMPRRAAFPPGHRADRKNGGGRPRQRHRRRRGVFRDRLAEELRRQDKAADLMVANNVLAHVPDINDFVSGFALLLKPHGVATFEFPHLMQLVRHNQFDTIYHEHFSYLSLTAVARIFDANGLAIFDVEEWPTHGGSLRVYAQRKDRGERPVAAAVNRDARARRHGRHADDRPTTKASRPAPKRRRTISWRF